MFNWFKSVSTSQDAALSNNKACDGSSSSSLNQPEHSIEESKSLAAVLSSLPVAPGVKRKCLADASAFVPPSKILKAGMCSNYSCGIYEMYDWGQWNCCSAVSVYWMWARGCQNVPVLPVLLQPSKQNRSLSSGCLFLYLFILNLNCLFFHSHTSFRFCLFNQRNTCTPARSFIYPISQSRCRSAVRKTLQIRVRV